MDRNYILTGGDDYLREKEELKLKEKFLSAGDDALNYSVCDQDDPDSMMDSLGTLPFLADKRVVLVRISQDIPDATLAVLEKYIDNPVDSSVLILSCGEAFQKKAAFRTLAKKMSVINIAKLTPQKVKNGINGFFKKQNIEISPEAVDLIFELKGMDPALIRSEIEKLAAYSGGKKIDVGDVQELVGRSVSESIFKLVDAINSRNCKWALRILNDLGDPRKEGLKIIGYLAGHIRIIQKIKLMSSLGAGTKEMEAEIGKRVYFVQPQAAKFSSEKIEKWISLLLRSDADIKRGRAEPSIVMETLLVKLSTS